MFKSEVLEVEISLLEKILGDNFNYLSNQCYLRIKEFKQKKEAELLTIKNMYDIDTSWIFEK